MIDFLIRRSQPEETDSARAVQSNAPAIEFYQRHGWRIARAIPHERFPITMLEMFKAIR
jgi:hypothetical protein